MRVVIIEEHPLCREGFIRVVESHPEIELVGAAATGRDGLHLVDLASPDLVVMAWSLPGMGGSALVRELRRRRPDAGVLALSASATLREVSEALAAGARGFVSKADPIEAVVAGMFAVQRGERFLGPAVARLPLRGVVADGRDIHDAGASPDVLAVLSEREREVFDLVVRGFKNRDIARELCVSIKTVDAHRNHLNKKLGCHSTLDVIRFAIANGLHALDLDVRTAPGVGRAAVA
jgi:DNA-binding NarL/FixJ family response regulator